MPSKFSDTAECRRRIDDSETFWLVWNPFGDSPIVRHPSEATARAEAERLARNAPGSRFYVLSAIALMERSLVVQTTELS
jgi:hypothetical protein